MDQEILFKASKLEKRHQEIQESIDYVDSQILELEQFLQSVREFSSFSGKEMISSIGKGVHVKTSLAEKDFLVEVGAGVVLKKTPEQTTEIIQNQLSRIKSARINMLSEMDNIRAEFQSLISNIEDFQN